MRAEKIYFDMDGVLADFDRGVRDLCGMEPMPQTEETDPKEDILWGAVRKVPHFYGKLEPCPGAKELFSAVRREYGDGCEVLTGIPKPRREILYAGEDKTEWMHRLFDPKVKVNIVYKEEKRKFCRGKGDVLIDDYPKNIREWQEMGGTGILHTDCAATLRALRNLGILQK